MIHAERNFIVCFFQGMTVKPLINWLKIPTQSHAAEINSENLETEAADTDAISPHEESACRKAWNRFEMHYVQPLMLRKSARDKLQAMVARKNERSPESSPEHVEMGAPLLVRENDKVEEKSNGVHADHCSENDMQL